MSEENKALVTDDGKMKNLEKQMLTQGDGVVVTSVEQLMEFARMAQSRKAGFDEEISKLMTPERAQRIKELREDNSWRSIALQTHEDWGTDATWMPESNQLAGMSLCEFAAKMLGEDYEKEPWN